MDAPFERLAAWVTWRKISQEALAGEIGCSQGLVSKILHGALPGRLVANAIERLTGPWPDGPIRAEEWDVVERARDEASATSESKSVA